MAGPRNTGGSPSIATASPLATLIVRTPEGNRRRTASGSVCSRASTYAGAPVGPRAVATNCRLSAANPSASSTSNGGGPPRGHRRRPTCWFMPRRYRQRASGTSPYRPTASYSSGRTRSAASRPVRPPGALQEFEQLGDLELVHAVGPVVGGVVAGVLGGLGDLVALDRQEQVDQLLAQQLADSGVLLQGVQSRLQPGGDGRGPVVQAVGQPLGWRWRLDLVADAVQARGDGGGAHLVGFGGPAGLAFFAARRGADHTLFSDRERAI